MTVQIAHATAYTTRAEWLEARRAGIGGSDVPAILGISPYRGVTQLSVWASKVGHDEGRDESTYSQRRGSHMESFIADELADSVDGLRAELLCGSELAIARSPEYEVLAYSPDAILRDPEDVRVLGEWKSQLRGAKRWEHEVPLDVQAQVQHGMYVMDLPAAYVAVDLGHEMRWDRVERDPGYELRVVPALLGWWERHVVGGEPPAPTGDDGPTLAAIYPEDHGGVVQLGAAFALEAERLDAVKSELKRLEAEKSEIEARVKAAIGDATRGALPDGSGWTWKRTRRVDPPRLTERVIEYRTLRRAAAPKRSIR